MTVPKHLEAAASRLEQAYWQIDLARKKPLSRESMREWLEALTDVTRALRDIEQANNESVHEKLHQLARHVGLGPFGPPLPRRRGLPRKATVGRRS